MPTSSTPGISGTSARASNAQTFILKAEGPGRDFVADAAEPDEQQGLALEVGTEESVAPQPSTHIGDRLAQPAGNHNHQPEGEISNRVAQNRRVGDRDSPGQRSRDRDVVEADADRADDPEVRCGVEHPDVDAARAN